MATLLKIVLCALILSGPVCAQTPTDLSPAVVVTLKFGRSTVELAKKESRDAFIVAQYGMPQLEPLFYEAYGPEGEVVYAGALFEPTLVHGPRLEQNPGPEPQGHTSIIEEGLLTIAIPLEAKPQKLVVWRRVKDGRKDARKKLLEAGL